MQSAIALVALASLAAPACAQPQADDAASRGAAIVASRSTGLCILCHAVPGVDDVHAGTLAPSLAGVGTRLDASELRLRLVAPRSFNPATIMDETIKEIQVKRKIEEAYPMLPKQKGSEGAESTN